MDFKLSEGMAVQPYSRASIGIRYRYRYARADANEELRIEHASATIGSVHGINVIVRSVD